MQQRSIRVKILKTTKSKVTLKFMSLNRKMPVNKSTFQERVETGLYDVVNPGFLDSK